MNTMNVTHFMKTGMLKEKDSDNLSCQLPGHAIEVGRANHPMDITNSESHEKIALYALMSCLWHLKKTVVKEVKDGYSFIACVDTETEHWDVRIAVKLYVVLS